MENKIVTAALSKKIKSILKKEGFIDSTTRVFWRYKLDRIEVINFYSTGNILFNIPSASFSISAGIYFLNLPKEFEIETKNGKMIPKENMCHFRFKAKKQLKQNYGNNDRNDTWIITDKESLEQCLDDCINVLHTQVFNFFRQFESIKYILNYLQTEEEDFQGGYTGIFGNGSLMSPTRLFHTAYFALLNKKKDIAKSALEKLIQYPDSYSELQRQFKKDYQKLLKNT